MMIQPAPSPTVPSIAIDSFWLPKQGSTIAESIDSAWNVVMWMSVVFFLILMVPMFYFMKKYKRRGPNDKTETLSHSTRIEVFWTLIPTVLCAALFFIGWTPFVNSWIAPAEAYEIQVTAQKWSWTFRYPDGTVSPGKLVIPRGKPIRLIMSSTDVLHSFYIPEYRIKRDVIPGQYTMIWFEATEARSTVIECTEYCGAPEKENLEKAGHSDMLATVQVMEEPQFAAWLETGGDDVKLPPAEAGKLAYSTWNCNTCHTLDGAAGTGPTFKGLFGRTEEMSDGTKIKVDENYLRESILQSQTKLVKGFGPVMPVFQGQLKDKKVDDLIAFIKEQK